MNWHKNLDIRFSNSRRFSPIYFSDHIKEVTTRLSGNALDVTLTNSKNSFTEALLFTHRGLSGPSSLQLSNYWNTGESFKIDFFPSQDLATYLKDKKPNLKFYCVPF